MNAMSRLDNRVGVRRVVSVFAAILAILVAMFAVSTSAFAANDDDASSAKTAAAESAMKSTVVATLGAEQYPLEGGGYVSGADLFTGKDSQVTVSQTEFDKLSKAGKNSFADDLIREVNSAPNDPGLQDKGVTQETATNWLKNLQNTKGLGTKLMSSILSAGTSADFIGAQAVFKPFAGPIGLAIGLITVVMMSLLVLSFAIDIAYIALPFFQNSAQGDKKGASRLVSKAAVNAVNQGESSQGGGKGDPIWVYLKSRVVSVFVLAITILMLVSGEVFNFVGTIIDMGLGFASQLWN